MINKPETIETLILVFLVVAAAAVVVVAVGVGVVVVVAVGVVGVVGVVAVVVAVAVGVVGVVAVVGAVGVPVYVRFKSFFLRLFKFSLFSLDLLSSVGTVFLLLATPSSNIFKSKLGSQNGDVFIGSTIIDS